MHARLFALFSLVTGLAHAQDTAPTMKAIRYHEYGAAEVLRYQDVPKPTPEAHEVLVRIHAAGVNPVDWKLRAGGIRSWVKALPHVPGSDVAGVVEEVGGDVKDFAVGDEVYGMIAVRRAGGGYAEYVAMPTSELARKPKKLDFVHAAAVPLAALTAWQALSDQAGLKAGQTVLIHAGAGGVGHFAVQFAKAKGAKVIATASESNHAFLKQLGADEVIDYRTQRFEELVHDADVVLDPIGGDTQARSFQVLEKGGYLVSIVQPPDPKRLAELGLRGSVFLVAPSASDLAEIGTLIDAGKVVVEVSAVVPLADARRAHELSETGHTRGKIVLEVVPARSK